MISATACPSCGCHSVLHFECNCGSCDRDYCGNCGRFTDLQPNESLWLPRFIRPCEVGQAEHRHVIDGMRSKVVK